MYDGRRPLFLMRSRTFTHRPPIKKSATAAVGQGAVGFERCDIPSTTVRWWTTAGNKPEFKGLRYSFHFSSAHPKPSPEQAGIVPGSYWRDYS